MKLHKCPVCEGKGIVPGGFYDFPGDIVQERLNDSPIRTWVFSKTSEMCRQCEGTGIIKEGD